MNLWQNIKKNRIKLSCSCHVSVPDMTKQALFKPIGIYLVPSAKHLLFPRRIIFSVGAACILKQVSIYRLPPTNRLFHTITKIWRRVFLLPRLLRLFSTFWRKFKITSIVLLCNVEGAKIKNS